MYAVIHGILSEIIVNINNIITMYIASIITMVTIINEVINNALKLLS